MIQNNFVIEHCGDYSDFPRLFILKVLDVDLLFHCAINEKTDEYFDYYAVFKLDPRWVEMDPTPWMELMNIEFSKKIDQLFLAELDFSGHRNRHLVFRDSQVLTKLHELCLEK